MPETIDVDPGDGISGLGTTIEGATTGPIGMITKVSIEGAEAMEIDISTMNAVSGWMKFIAGMKDGKGINLELLYEKTNMGILSTRHGAPNESWTVEFPDGSTYVQSGFIKKVGAEIPVKDKISQSVTLRMSGPPVFHAGS